MIQLVVVAALTSLGVAGPLAAQEIDWGSEKNNEVWIGVTQPELRELAAEAGGVWTDLPDDRQFRISSIDWPGLPPVMVREFHCEASQNAPGEQSCGAMMLSVDFDQPADLEAWWLEKDRWLAFGRVNSRPALYRVEFSRLGTTRGHILSTLVLFRSRALDEFRSGRNGG